MESVMANQIEEKQWYLAVGERSLGPISTDLVARGIRSGKVPVTAWVCQVGDTSWAALSSFSEFHSAIDGVLAEAEPANSEYRSESAAVSAVGPTENDGADDPTANVPSAAVVVPSVATSTVDEDETTGQRSLLPYERSESTDTTLPSVGLGVQAAPSDVFSSTYGDEVAQRNVSNSYSDISGQREIDPALRQEAVASMAEPAATRTPASADDDLGIEITFDEDHDSVDWNVRFQSYFLVGSAVELPEEEKLLRSLHETPKSTFQHDEALWNLALCLAFGTDSVAEASAIKFYDALEMDVEPSRAPERVEWICRTLLSKGFMPSGIPRIEGNRGVDVLRRACPRSLVDILERESAG
jgi:hypothetical protein